MRFARSFRSRLNLFAPDFEHYGTVDPITAATQPDPYPFYARLIAERPLYFDETLQLWVASSAEKVSAVLHSDLCRVRPVAEPIPGALLGSESGKIYRHLIRFNDGSSHCPFKGALTGILALLDAPRVSQRAAFWAQHLISSSSLRLEELNTFRFSLPVYVVADLLGASTGDLPELALWTKDFVRGLAANASPERLARGNAAASSLLALCHSLLESGAPGLLADLTMVWDDEEAVVANGIGLLMQSFEATAGLIGNALLMLARRPDLLHAVLLEPRLLPAFVAEVNRFDPAVQSTRRFVARDGVIAGQSVRAGDTILVLLAAANRDPKANPRPEHFDLTRVDLTRVDLTRAPRRDFGFGEALHACPGAPIASTIAQAGLEVWLASDLRLEELAGDVSYQPSLNARIPIFSPTTFRSVLL